MGDTPIDMPAALRWNGRGAMMSEEMGTMAEASDGVGTADALQTVCLVVGFTGGLLPLGRVLFGAGPGRPMRWVNGQLGDPPAYLVPICVILLAVTLIALLERGKSSSSRSRERRLGGR